MHATFPPWLTGLASLSLLIAAVCFVAIVVDEARHPQRMWIMNLVWPLTALFGSVLWLTAYWRWGRLRPDRSRGQCPFAASVLKGASHCGAGCVLGDLISEWLAFAVPGVALWFGWRSLFAEKMFAVWICDFLLAFALGVGFQYFTIKPMRHLSVAEGLLAALKADIASITAWQVGMYGAMALLQFGVYRPVFGGVASVASPEFWFAMQLAMLAGFGVSYPVNWMLIRWGVKEPM